MKPIILCLILISAFCFVPVSAQAAEYIMECPLTKPGDDTVPLYDAEALGNEGVRYGHPADEIIDHAGDVHSYIVDFGEGDESMQRGSLECTYADKSVTFVPFRGRVRGCTYIIWEISKGRPPFLRAYLHARCYSEIE